MELKNLDDLFVHHLKDIYSAENQLIRALPELAKAATSPDLKRAFQEHLEQTRGQVTRLETIFRTLGRGPRGVVCKGMQGLVEEGTEIVDEEAEPEVRDAGLIAAAQKAEHYEIASYGTVATFAKQLGHQEALTLLLQTLEEEKQADAKLTQLAKGGINQKAEAPA